MLQLQRGALVLELAPEVGGSISALYTALPDGSALHWLRPAQPQALRDADPLGMASFPLLPWCNRIRDGRAHACGRDVVLPGNELSPHAIHGLGWRRPWQVASVSAHHAQLDLQMPGQSPGWPWAWRASQRFELDAQGLTCRMTLCNDSATPMPCGLGHHPYFLHLPGTRLQCRVQAMWASDDQLLPTALVRPDFLDAMAQGVELAGLDLDNNFIGWDRRFVVSAPGRPSLQLQAASPLDFFVLYCPRGAPHFCAEPVSHCTDWLNLVDRPLHEVGGSVLAPGHSLQALWSLHRLDVGA